MAETIRVLVCNASAVLEKYFALTSRQLPGASTLCFEVILTLAFFLFPLAYFL